MFDVGFWELALIGLIALIVVGPAKLPALARTVGKWVGQAQRMTREFRRDLEREINMAEVRKLQEQLRAPELDKLAQDVNKEVGQLNQELNRQISTESLASDPKPASPASPAAPAADTAVTTSSPDNAPVKSD
ncbi:MAG: twin-arginine translocase subunit TatB [Gammaproteobacteria bacterium]|nr:twin-arginine translocase subunit TatB [Gammaproteobacteria bacterium]